MKTRIFNIMDKDPGECQVPSVEKFIHALIDTAPLIDDVDTSILSFLDAYGQPPHLDIDDADDSDLSQFDDDDVDVDVDVDVKKPDKPAASGATEQPADAPADTGDTEEV